MSDLEWARGHVSLPSELVCFLYVKRKPKSVSLKTLILKIARYELGSLHVEQDFM